MLRQIKQLMDLRKHTRIKGDGVLISGKQVLILVQAFTLTVEKPAGDV